MRYLIYVLVILLTAAYLKVFAFETSKVPLIRVAVIDSGFTKGYLKRNIPLCEDGHRDFSGYGDPFTDVVRHGTHVAGVIGDNAKDAKYCLVILKYFHTATDEIDTLKTTIKAIVHATDLNVNVINYSGGGKTYSELEKFAIEKAQAKGITFIAAAGNESSDLRKVPYYPACYNSSIVMVTAVDVLGKVIPPVNYFGKDSVKRIKCDNVRLLKAQGDMVGVETANGNTLYMTGSSQATAVVTGKLIKKVYDLSKGGK